MARESTNSNGASIKSTYLANARTPQFLRIEPAPSHLGGHQSSAAEQKEFHYRAGWLRRKCSVMRHCGQAIRVRPRIISASTFQKSSTSVLSGVPIRRFRYRRLCQGQCRWNRHRLSRPRYIAGEPFIARLSVVGGITNYELLTRWMQLGSFLPWYRNHYDGYNKQFQEPYAYGEPVPSNCRKYVELRYRMMQVYYDAMYQWTQTGMPIARALFLNDPNDPQVYANLIQLPGMPVPCVNTEFYVGPGLSGSSDYRSTRQPQPSHPAHPQRLPPREQRLVPVRGQHRSYRRRYYRRSGAVSVTAGSIPSPSMFVPAPFCRFANWSNGSGDVSGRSR